MTLKSSDLKRMARNAMRGRWGYAIALLVLTALISVGLTAITSLFSSTTSLPGTIIYWVASVIVALITGLFSAGSTYFFLNICRGRNYHIDDMFAAFRMSPDRFLIVSIITSSVSLLSTLPSYFWQPSGEDFLFYSLVISLLALAGSILSIVISAFFGLSYYLLFDFPGMGAIDSLRMSARLMKGNKGRYLYITFSFMGWIFLSFFTGFIALLWIEPYMQMTMTYFYADILDRYERLHNEVPPTESVPPTGGFPTMENHSASDSFTTTQNHSASDSFAATDIYTVPEELTTENDFYES